MAALIYEKIKETHPKKKSGISFQELVESPQSSYLLSVSDDHLDRVFVNKVLVLVGGCRLYLGKNLKPVLNLRPVPALKLR